MNDDKLDRTNNKLDRIGDILLSDKDYDYINCKYIGSEYGNLRRERAKLQQRMILHNDESVKPRIREITAQIQDALSSRSKLAT